MLTPQCNATAMHPPHPSQACSGPEPTVLSNLWLWQDYPCDGPPLARAWHCLCRAPFIPALYLSMPKQAGLLGLSGPSVLWLLLVLAARKLPLPLSPSAHLLHVLGSRVVARLAVLVLPTQALRAYLESTMPWEVVYLLLAGFMLQVRRGEAGGVHRSVGSGRCTASMMPEGSVGAGMHGAEQQQQGTWWSWCGA